VITGQVVETFDQQFHDLYLTSRGVSLSKVSMADEPIPDPVQYTAPAPLPASIARKLINPKYALVTAGNHASPTSSGQNSSNKNSQNPLGLRMPKERIKECVVEPPLHPGLAHLEKAYLIPYLPTWPEPDPPSDVIGFINIRDDKRAYQVHLQRSERFETSQAIRFSSPFTPAAQRDKQAPEKIHTDAKPSESTDRDRGQESGAQPVLAATPSPPEPEPADEMDSTVPPEQIDVPRDLSPPKESRLKDTHGSPPSPPPQGTSEPTAEEEALPADTPPPVAVVVMAPPVPKPRTLQLVIEPASPLTKSGQPQISLVRKIHIPHIGAPEASEGSASSPRGRLASRRDTEDKDSGDGSQDSTKVMCDRDRDRDPATRDNPSSSTASDEEFYECGPSETGEGLTNGGGGATTGSGSGQGGRHGDGLNVMARFSQSMLDLRPPSQPEEGSASLIHESQQLRRQMHQSPHRHIGQVGGLGAFSTAML